MLLTETIKANEPWVKGPKIIETEYTEIQDLVNKGTYRIVLRTELPDDASLITARYIISIKSGEEKEERYNVKYIIGGHLDIMKDYLVRGA